MANTVQIKRGSTASVAGYTGPVGELIYNLDTGRLHAQDGSTAGGNPHALISDVDLKADADVTVSAGAGLTGGGTLAANRTLALSSASIASLSLADSAVQPAITITAGTGLTGGGNLTANRTVALNAASIASLGKADTALQAPGGSAGQVLVKSSNTKNDVGWVSSEAATAVSYAPQTLTPAQQEQARNNIGSASIAQGNKADTALQTLTAGTNITISGTGTSRTINATVPPAPVTSVNTKTGAVVLSAADVGALPSGGKAADSSLLNGQTAAQLPVSTATQTALNGKVSNSRIVISLDDPSGGVDGDIWFKVEA